MDPGKSKDESNRVSWASLVRVYLACVCLLVGAWSCTLSLKPPQNTDGNDSCSPWREGRSTIALDEEVGVVGCLILLDAEKPSQFQTSAALLHPNGELWGWNGSEYSAKVPPRLTKPALSSDESGVQLFFLGLSQDDALAPSGLPCQNLVQENDPLHCLHSEAVTRCAFALALSPRSSELRVGLPSEEFPNHPGIRVEGGASCRLYSAVSTPSEVPATPDTPVADTPSQLPSSYSIDAPIETLPTCGCTPSTSQAFTKASSLTLNISANQVPEFLTVSSDGNTLLAFVRKEDDQGSEDPGTLFVASRANPSSSFAPFFDKMKDDKDEYIRSSFVPTGKHMYLFDTKSFGLIALDDLRTQGRVEFVWRSKPDDLPTRYKANSIAAISQELVATVSTDKGTDGVLALWGKDGNDKGQLLQNIELPHIQCVTLTADGSHLLVGGQSQNKASIRVFQLNKGGTPSMTPKAEIILSAEDTYVTEIVVHPNNEVIYFSTSPNNRDIRGAKWSSSSGHGQVYQMPLDDMRASTAKRLVGNDQKDLLLTPYAASLALRADGQLLVALGAGSTGSMAMAAGLQPSVDTDPAMTPFTPAARGVSVAFGACGEVYTLSTTAPHVEAWKVPCAD